MVFGLFYRRLM